MQVRTEITVHAERRVKRPDLSDRLDSTVAVSVANLPSSRGGLGCRGRLIRGTPSRVPGRTQGGVEA